MVEVATAASSLKGPGSIWMRRIHEDNRGCSGPQLRDCTAGKAIGHLATYALAIETLGLANAAQVEQQMVEAEDLERRRGYRRARLQSRSAGGTGAPGKGATPTEPGASAASSGTSVTPRARWLWR